MDGKSFMLDGRPFQIRSGELHYSRVPRAEWDLGGIPAWLLTVPGINMRFMDPRYLNPAKAWMTRMGGMLTPLSIANGGSLLMVQV